MFYINILIKYIQHTTMTELGPVQQGKSADKTNVCMQCFTVWDPGSIARSTLFLELKSALPAKVSVDRYFRVQKVSKMFASEA